MEKEGRISVAVPGPRTLFSRRSWRDVVAMRSLVVPVDRTEVSERAVPVAASLALRFGAEVIAVLVAPPSSPVGDDEAYLGGVVDRFPTSVACRRVVDHTDDLVAKVNRPARPLSRRRRLVPNGVATWRGPPEASVPAGR